MPAGWTQVLPGLILSDTSHFNTLVSNAMQPGHIADCALQPHSWPVSVVPVFVITDDGGRTWQQRPIPLVGSVWGCDLAGDLLNPDIYAVSLIHLIDGKADGYDETLVTDDAGVITAISICEGAEPSLVISGMYGTFVRSLPPLR